MPIFLVFLLGVLFATLSAHAQEQNITFNKPLDTPKARYVIDLLDIAYSRIDKNLHIIEYNHQSSLNAADKGFLDGQLGRISAIEKDYHNLVRVDFVLYSFDLVLLTQCQNCQLSDMQKVSFSQGYEVASNYLTEHHFKGKQLGINGLLTQLNLLSQGKVDGILMPDFHAKRLLVDPALSTYHIQSLQTYNTYHYLHKRHRDWIPKLENTLNELKMIGAQRYFMQKHGL